MERNEVSFSPRIYNLFDNEVVERKQQIKLSLENSRPVGVVSETCKRIRDRGFQIEFLSLKVRNGHMPKIF